MVKVARPPSYEISAVGVTLRWPVSLEPTKPQGSGIGLVLSRQIAEGHGGSLELANRVEQRGCIVKVRLPRIGPENR